VATVCMGCGNQTLNGTRCPRCAGGYRANLRGGNPYATPAYTRVRKGKLEEHRRTFGPRCPRCLVTEDRSIRRTWLTLNHITPIGAGGSVLGPTEVLCLSCNDKQAHVDRPGLSRSPR
jgi:hypothetical protein